MRTSAYVRFQMKEAAYLLTNLGLLISFCLQSLPYPYRFQKKMIIIIRLYFYTDHQVIVYFSSRQSVFTANRWRSKVKWYFPYLYLEDELLLCVFLDS